MATVRTDALVQEQFDRVLRRIRLLDLATAGLALAVLTLLYGLAVAVLDRAFDLAPVVRQLGLAGFLVAFGTIALFGVVRPIVRSVNPYYAARRLEEVVPDAKNSLVNWLDLHEQHLPAAIQASLGQRAVKDLGRADLDEAVSGQRVVWLGGAVAILLVGLFVLLVALGGGGLSSSLGRAFSPFAGGVAGKRTQITLVKPTNGDAVVSVGQSVQVAVRVAGRVPTAGEPDALRLMLRYRESEPYEDQPLEPEAGDLWATTVPAFRVHNGFLYKVVGGDDETPEYRVTACASPLVTDFEVTYRYRPYTGWADDVTRDANLKAPRGTEASLLVRTNRPVKEGRLELETREGKQTIPAELVADEPQALRVKLVMELDGQYRVWFTAIDGDASRDPMPYTVTVLPDLPPKVELTRPGDVSLPANGTLKVEGSASDDFGVSSMTLRLRVIDGPRLADKPYRNGRSFRLADGGFPKTLDYKDFVALDNLPDELGKRFTLEAGMRVEYWLEAEDGCDLPKPQRAESRHAIVTITEPGPDAKEREEERKQAGEDQKNHEAGQDKKLDKENSERQSDAGGGGDGSLDEKAKQIKEALERQGGEGQGGEKKPNDKGNGTDTTNEGSGGTPEKPGGGTGEPRPMPGAPTPGSNSTSGEGPPKDPTAADVERMQKQMEQGDAPAREQAAKTIEEWSKTASDPQLRKQCQGLCKNPGGSSGGNPGSTPGNNTGTGDGGKPGSNTGEGAGGKPGSATGGPPNTGTKPGGGGSGTEPEKEGVRGEGNKVRTGDQRPGTPRTGADEERARSEADPAHARRAGVLQLEDFSKIDRNILKDLKMSDEEFEAFRKAYTDRMRKSGPEVLPATQGGALSNSGAREVKGDRSKPGDARRSGLGQAPPEFRDVFRRFTGGPAK